MFDSRLPRSDTEWLPRRAGHTGLKFSNGLEMGHDKASRAADRFTCPLTCSFVADGVEIKTDGGYSEKAIAAVLWAEPKRWVNRDQPLKFSNETAASHSDESRACAAYYKKVVAGKIEIPGFTATFVNGDAKIEGIQRSAKKVRTLLA